MERMYFRRFLSLAMAFLMVLSNVPVQAFATEVEACTHAIQSVSTTAATCTVDGAAVTTCDSCGETLSTETLTATGHSYVDGACSVCGESEPGATPAANEEDSSEKSGACTKTEGCTLASGHEGDCETGDTSGETGEDEPVKSEGDITVYFDNSTSNWGYVVCYYQYGEGVTPKMMTADENGTLYAYVPGTATYLFFSNCMTGDPNVSQVLKTGKLTPEDGKTNTYTASEGEEDDGSQEEPTVTEINLSTDSYTITKPGTLAATAPSPSGISVLTRTPSLPACGAPSTPLWAASWVSCSLLLRLSLRT